MLLGVDLIFLFINQIDPHAHVIVSEDLMLGMQLDTAVLVLARRLVRVQSVVEQFRLYGDVRVHVAELEARVEAVRILLLELLVALGWASRAMLLLMMVVRLAALARR